MANSEQTKRALAEGLKTALRSQEFDQITVADITECSEVSRNTFYYHSRDKQELVDWIFHTDLGPVLRDSRPGRTWNEALTELLARLQRSRVFYAGILRNQGQDRFSSCLFEDCSQMVSSLLARRPGELSLAEQEMAARFYAHAVIGLAMDWIRGDTQAEPEEIVTMLQKLINRR